MLVFRLMLVIINLRLTKDLCHHGSKRNGMFDVIFIILLIMQGGIHFAEFYKMIDGKKAKGAPPIKSTGRLNKPFLLLAGFFFLITVILFVQKDAVWIVVSICTVLFSQYLIILNWRSIWYSTFLNVLIIIGIALSYSSWKLEKIIDERINFMYADNSKTELKVTVAMINSQPPIVQKWLFRANVMDKKMCESVSLKQVGEMRTSPSGKWMKVKAKEYFTTTKPAFLWTAEVDGGLFMKLRGIDQYRNGIGHMKIQWFSLFPVVNASGIEIDQGCLLRYMAETIWFPSAALRPYIHWEGMDSTHAKATMYYGHINASGIFTFNALGDVVSFEAKRYYNRPTGATLEDWSIQIDTNSCKYFEGIRVPTKASLSWNLESGTFNWFNLEVFDIEYK